MRFVILTQYYPPEIGAPQTRLAALTRELVRRGHAVEVVTAMPNHLLGRTHEDYRKKFYVREMLDGAVIHRTWVYAAMGTGARRMLNYLSFTLSSLWGLFQTRRADVVFVESPPLFLSIPGWIAAKRSRAALIFNVADLWPDTIRDLGVLGDGPLLRAAEKLEAWTYARATLVNAVTDGIERDLRERKHVASKKLRFLPNGIDVNAFAPRSRSADLAARLRLDGRPLFLYAGTHGIAQGLHNLIEAASMVPEATMLFVGAGTVKRALVEIARKRGVSNVRFLDPVRLDDMPEYFSLACASIVPLVRNDVHLGARPSKIFPSFACGIPVIFSGEGEGAALIRDAGAGIVVPPEDPAAIAGAMREMIDNPQAHRAMSERARNVAVERFAWPAIVDRWLASL